MASPGQFVLINTPVFSEAKKFYQDIPGVELLMDYEWVATYGSQTEMNIQISFAMQGPYGTKTPDLSIEADDIDAVYELMKAAGFNIEYGPVDEPWGVRRFYVRDPLGTLINILAQ